MLFPYFENTSGFKFTSISAMNFFVLLNAFYGGAMTMFFASEISIPFLTLKDTLQAFPDWKVIHSVGKSMLFTKNTRTLLF